LAAKLRDDEDGEDSEPANDNEEMPVDDVEPKINGADHSS
jgi:hypothetical protein